MRASAQRQRLHPSQVSGPQDDAAAAALSFSLSLSFFFSLLFSLFLSIRAVQPQRPVSLKFSRCSGGGSSSACKSAPRPTTGAVAAAVKSVRCGLPQGQQQQQQFTRGRAMRALLRVPRQLLLLSPKRRPTSGEGLSRARNRQCEPLLGHAARAAKCEPPLGHAAHLQRAGRANDRGGQQVSTLTCLASPALAHDKLDDGNL